MVKWRYSSTLNAENPHHTYGVIEYRKTLLDISEEKPTEYQGYIYTIYNLVRATGENQGLGLLQIMENTDQLVTGLKNLNSNIKRYIWWIDKA